ncbi:MAG: YceI family protein [Actinomycetota bacterium]|nr:YceI family protein [Actinomycetota bacterium]
MAQTNNEVGTVQLPPPGKYELDLAHTSVEFLARHILTKTRGRFTEFSGTIDVAERPEDSSVQVEIQAGSVQTNNEQRDAHLKSGDFFELETYPLITFRSTAVRPTGANTFELDGELTVKDVTRPVTLTGEYGGTSIGMNGEPIFGASAKTTIDREDWDMTWNMVVEAGNFLVGKTVDLEIEVEAHKVG